MKNLKTNGLTELEKIAKKAVDFSGSFSRTAVSDSNGILGSVYWGHILGSATINDILGSATINDIIYSCQD